MPEKWITDREKEIFSISDSFFLQSPLSLLQKKRSKSTFQTKVSQITKDGRVRIAGNSQKTYDRFVIPTKSISVCSVSMLRLTSIKLQFRLSPNQYQYIIDSVAFPISTALDASFYQYYYVCTCISRVQIKIDSLKYLFLPLVLLIAYETKDPCIKIQKVR